MMSRRPNAQRVFFVVPCLLSVAAYGQDCSEPSDTAGIVVLLEAAESAFSDLDVDGFRSATDQVARELPCVTDVFPSSLAARYHRFVGLRAFVDREQAKAVSAFAAARTIEPEYEFPESFIPSGNPVMNSYLALDVTVDEWSVFNVPSEGTIQLDGKYAEQRSTRFPHLYQYLDATGVVADTAYVFPEQLLPQYPGNAVAEVIDVASPLTGDAVITRKSGPNTPLLISAGVSLVGAIGLYAASSSSLVKYNSDDITDQQELDRLRRSTNRAMFASIGLGTMSLGLGTSAFLVARW